MAKGIAIMAVVLGHINFAFPSSSIFPTRLFLYGLWHVSVFYVIGGFFINEQKLTKPYDFIKGKIKSLYCLILYIYIPYTLLHNFFFRIGFYDSTMDYFGKHIDIWGFGDFIKHILAAVFFAGREPLLGPMWFVYVLFLALCLLSIISWVVRKFCHTDQRYSRTMLIVLLLMAIVSCTLTNIFHLTIPRCNNIFTAMWFIYMGLLMNRKYHVVYNNGFIAVISLLLIYHLATMTSGIAFNSNVFDDIASFSIATLSCVYIICYACKKMAGNRIIRSILSYIGENSFYIMGLQFTGFHICTFILNLLGYNYNLAELTTPQIDNYWLLFLYMFMGVAMPLIIVEICRFLKRSIVQACKVL
jgi:fucose 4-O-acetylase-like acetyltransferase